MAKKTKAQLKLDIDRVFATNQNGGITEAKEREFLKDLVDSLMAEP